MIRKIILFAAFLLTLTGIKAQSVGEWTIYSQFLGNIDDVIAIKDKVYFTSSKRLFSYDKSMNESYTYTTKNKLNDTNVEMIRYNPDGKYLLVAYDNSNIDLIYDNGRVVNMSDIKDATLTYNKNINNITFVGDRIYLATEFGIVIYDGKKHEVVESGIFGTPISTVFPIKDKLFIGRKDAAEPKKINLYQAPLTAHHNTLDKFTDTKKSFYMSWVLPVGDHSMLYGNTSDNKVYRYTFEMGEDPQKWETIVADPFKSYLHMSANGNYVITDSSIVILDENGDSTSTITLPELLKKQIVATYSGAGSVWAANEDGVGEYNIEGGSITEVTGKIKPEGIVTDEVFFLQADDHGAIWAGNLGASLYKPMFTAAGDWAEVVQATTRLKNGKPEDMNVYDATVHVSYSVEYQKKFNNKRLYGGCTGFAVDPENPNRYFQGNHMEGLFVIEDNKEVISFSTFNGNFPNIILGGWNRVEDVKFDKDGNLWVGLHSGNVSKAPLWVLPKKTLRSKELNDIKAEDWLPTKIQGVDVGNKDITLLVCKKSPIVFYWSGVWEQPIGVLQTKNTWSDPTDDYYFEFFDPQDQDGKVWKPSRVICAVEDKNGKVWFGGSSGGVIEIAKPGELQENSRITRIKVPRNDGTNYADYLCETDIVYSIAVDNSNRKWIATESSGVYLVSENGDKIIEHFTVENSPLPSNQVLSVVCDPNSNMVYFGLKSGLISYSSTSSPEAEDYSEIYAYPNPVKPDYTGYITIKGLMNDSLVKITDAAGNVVFETRSEGGMAIWDGFDNNYNRVKTGVYYVFASQGPDGDSKGAVTKIMVIR